MESSFSLHYVYLHKTQLGLPFYIGIGTKQYGDHQTTSTKYARAYSKTGRTQFWNKIVKKYGIQIEILVESNNYDYIKSQEIFFISKFGRRDKKEGTLCNLTNGGEGATGRILSDSSRKKMSETWKIKYLTGNSPFCNPEHYKNLSNKMKGNSHAKGRKLTGEQKKNLYEKRIEKLSKRVIQESIEGNFIKEWYTTVDAANFYSITYKAIWKACKNYHKKAKSKGFLWRFKEE